MEVKVKAVETFVLQGQNNVAITSDGPQIVSVDVEFSADFIRGLPGKMVRVLRVREPDIRNAKEQAFTLLIELLEEIEERKNAEVTEG